LIVIESIAQHSAVDFILATARVFELSWHCAKRTMQIFIFKASTRQIIVWLELFKRKGENCDLLFHLLLCLFLITDCERNQVEFSSEKC
jgi:uncharacterized membrane protein